MNTDNNQVERSLSPSSTSPPTNPQPNPQRTILHEKKKNAEGEWKTVHSYEVLGKLGKGGFAKVYLAKQIESNDQYAIKVIDKSSLDKEQFKEKLNQEIRFQKSLNHENVVKYYSSFEDSQNVYIVLEYCSNQTFKELLDRRKKLTEIEVKSHLIQIITSLKYIHSKGILHREQVYFKGISTFHMIQKSLKIANIFLNDKMVVKIADFGLSAMIKFQSQKRKTVCGTPNYIAPEVLKNLGHDFLVDNWAVGVIVYTFLVGKPPFEEKEVENTLKNENCQISKEAKEFITQTLILDPNQRLTLDQMLLHPFLKSEELIIPRCLPTSTLALPPTASFIRRIRKPDLMVSSSQANPFLKQQTQVDQKENEKQQAFDNSTNENKQQHQQQQQLSTGISVDKMQLNKVQSSINIVSSLCNNNNNNNNNEQQSLQKEGIQKVRSQENMSIQRQLQGYSNKYNPLASKQITRINISTSNSPHASNPSSPRISNPPSPNYQLLTLQLSPDVNKNSIIDLNKAALIKQQPLQSQVGENKVNKMVQVQDYIDCRSKFGLAYCLCNGVVGIQLNNGSIVQLFQKSLEHIEKTQQDQVQVFNPTVYLLDSTNSIASLPQHIHHLYNLILSISQYFINKNNNLISIQRSNNDCNDIQSEGFDKHVYIKKYIISKQAAIFRFSNKNLQAIFSDKSEVIVEQSNKYVFFKDKQSTFHTYPVQSAFKQELPNNLRKRINYIKDIFLGGCAINTNNGNNGIGGIQANLNCGSQVSLIQQSNNAINKGNTIRSESPQLIITPLQQQSQLGVSIAHSYSTTKLQTRISNLNTSTSTTSNPNNNNNNNNNNNENNNINPTYYSLHQKSTNKPQTSTLKLSFHKDKEAYLKSTTNTTTPSNSMQKSIQFSQQAHSNTKISQQYLPKQVRSSLESSSSPPSRQYLFTQSPPLHPIKLNSQHQ